MKIKITSTPCLVIEDAWMQSVVSSKYHNHIAAHVEGSDSTEIKSAVLSALIEYDATYYEALLTATAVLRHAVDIAKRDDRSMDAQVLADANLIIASLIDEENERVHSNVLSEVQEAHICPVKDGE